MLLVYKKSIDLGKILFLILFISVALSQKNGRVDYSGQVKDYHIINGQEYIAGDDGSLLMYVNIWGHVESPGTYLVYEGIDLLTLLSLAGGPSSGAQLSKIEIIRSEKSNFRNELINLNNYIDNTVQVTIGPHDTIYIKESMTSYIFSKTNVLTTLLQIINIAYIMNKF